MQKTSEEACSQAHQSLVQELPSLLTQALTLSLARVILSLVFSLDRSASPTSWSSWLTTYLKVFFVLTYHTISCLWTCFYHTCSASMVIENHFSCRVLHNSIPFPFLRHETILSWELVTENTSTMPAAASSVIEKYQGIISEHNEVWDIL